jgi:hypothetical protein
VAEDVRRIVITAALFVALALLLWAFAVLLWDLLKERRRGEWLRVVLVVVLAPLCALAAAAVSAGATLALVTALEPEEVPAGLSEAPARTEPADPESTSEGRRPETITDRTASPSAAPASSASPSATAYPSATPSATSSASAPLSPESRHERRDGHHARRRHF